MRGKALLKRYRFTLMLLLCCVGLSADPAYAQDQKKPNILVIWGDDIGHDNISAYNRGMLAYNTPNIDRLAKEGALFDEFFGYLYHLDAMEDPWHPNYPTELRDKVGPRNVLHSFATNQCSGRPPFVRAAPSLNCFLRETRQMISSNQW